MKHEPENLTNINSAESLPDSQQNELVLNCKVIPRSEHCISRQNISTYALKVMYRLRKHNFEAYLVGGGVRDILLGKHPKDFDVATNATPDEIRAMFKNSRIIGRRFRIVHVFFHAETIEVTTFRAELETSKLSTEGNLLQSEHGMLLRDNVYGSIEEDARRRDFTINALYYNIDNFSVLDFMDALTDLKQHILRIIGDPETRYREDPVRLLRAVRFAAKLDFTLEEKTAAAIFTCKNLLNHISSARIYDEFLKLFFTGMAEKVYQLLSQYQLFDVLFPSLNPECLPETKFSLTKYFSLLFNKTDQRINTKLSVSPAFLLAAVLYPALLGQKNILLAQTIPENVAYFQAMHQILSEQGKMMAVSRAVLQDVRNIWQLLHGLQNPKPRTAAKLATNYKYRAGYDLLLLLSEVGAAAPTLVKWWEEFAAAPAGTQKKLLNQLKSVRKK